MARHWFAPPEIDGEPFGAAWMKLTLTWGYFWGGCLTSLMVLVNLLADRPLIASLEAFYTASLFLGSIVMMRTGKLFRLFTWTGMLGMMLFPSLDSFLAGGFFGSGGRGVWAFTAPMMSALLLPDWCTAIFFLLFMGLLGLSLWFPGPFPPYSPDLLPYLFQFHVIGLFLTTFGVFFIFFRKMQWQNETLHRQEVERQEVAVKSEVLNVMSHEIRTPLNAIIGLLDLVALEPLPQGARDHVATIQHASRNLLSLVSDVLDYSKIVEGKVELERVPVDVADVVRNAVAAHRMAAESNGTRLRVAGEASGTLWVEGDPTRLGQIVNNLVSNAVKFSPLGTVEVDVSRTGEGVEIVVRDDGVGIAPEHLEKIFKPFSQAETSITRRFGGTGLGLAIVQGIVSTSNGRIEVRSGRETGSEFLVRLPWKSVPPPVAASRPFSLRPWSILVVDDNAVNLKVAGRLLEKLGMRATCVGGGEEAIAWLSRNACDLVFMDLQMPGLDGYGTADRIRRDVPRPVPIVALSAEVLDTTQERLRESGMRGFLGKPINLERLRRCLELLQAEEGQGDAVEASTLQGFLFPPPAPEPV